MLDDSVMCSCCQPALELTNHHAVTDSLNIGGLYPVRWSSTP